jgi:NAD-dependent dihydropyrimidine dehydrogenase PreA subunit
MISIDINRCTGCGLCCNVCPHGVIEMNGETAFLSHDEKCVSCGACGLNCPSAAIDVIKKTGCVVTIIKEDILKIKENSQKCGGDACA